MERELALEEKGKQSFFVNIVRRTGTETTLIKLSYFEPETVHPDFNSIFNFFC